MKKFIHKHIIKNYTLRNKMLILFSWIPHDIRRVLFRVIAFNFAKEHDRLRNEENLSLYSLAQFDQSDSIFVHIPKCGGSSVSKTLYGNMAYGHKTAIIYTCIYPKKIYENMFKFTFVRNPWDRMVSAYFYLSAKVGIDEELEWSKKNIRDDDDFESFVMRWLNEKSCYSNLMFIPQYIFILGAKGEKMVDYIGRLENFDEDYAYIANRLGVDKNLMHVNSSVTRESSDYRQYYNDQTRELVARVYRKDIELLGYEF